MTIDLFCNNSYLALLCKGLLRCCLDRKSGRLLACRKARVFPLADGVPYYMLRELAFMRRANHPNIATLELANLYDNKLFMFFEYVWTFLS